MPRTADEITADLEKSARDAAVLRAGMDARVNVADHLMERTAQAIRDAEAAVIAGLEADNTENAEAQVVRAKKALARAAIYAQGTSSELTNTKDEWKECRSSIDRFDKALVDLRKTGFGFITAIIAGAAFLLKRESAPTENTPDVAPLASLAELPLVRLSVFLVFMLLILVVFLIDRAHQIWLGVAVKRATYLENLLAYRITRNISGAFKGWEALALAILIYIGLLVMNGFVFFMSFEPSGMLIPSWTDPQLMVWRATIGAIIFIFVVIFVTWFIGRKQGTEQ